MRGGYTIICFIRYVSKQCINKHQIYSRPIIAALMTFEANKSINLIWSRI